MPSKRGKDRSDIKPSSSAVKKSEKNNNVRNTTKTKAAKETEISAATTIRSNGDEVIEETKNINDNSGFLERNDAKAFKASTITATTNANVLQEEATFEKAATTITESTDKSDIPDETTTLNDFATKAMKDNENEEDDVDGDKDKERSNEENKAELNVDPLTVIDNKSKEPRHSLTENLNLTSSESMEQDESQLPYCPMTPRSMIDTNEHEGDPFYMDEKKYNSKNIQKRQAVDAADNDDVADSNEEDDNYGDQPEEELLVQFLGEANRIAEARLAARRQARAEAREIRMRELERQQKEQEQNADRVFDMHNVGASTSSDTLARTRLASGLNVGGLLNATRVVSASSMSSRRSSEDSLEEEGRSLRDIRYELKDVEERFRKAMIANAQLDNDRASQTFEMKLLKDKIETMHESYAQLEREFKDKSRDYNALKRNLDRLTLELKLVQGQLNERDTLIAEQGLVIVAVENADGTDAKRALVNVENANVLASVQGSLDVRLKKFNEEKQQLVSEVQKLQEQLETFKSEGKGRGNSMNGPLASDEDYEAQREANKIISDYKYKLQKAEQEIASLQASLARSETQVIRYKSTAEAAEKAEAELKVERRKLQRENRETMERLEELETSNNHLLKRLDKLKNAKSALLKDL